MVNRAPVSTLWAAVVAEVLGFENDEALTLGRTVAGLNAYSKGVSLGLFQPTPKEVQEQRREIREEETVTVDLLPRAVPAKHTSKNHSFASHFSTISNSYPGLTPETHQRPQGYCIPLGSLV